MKRVLLKSILIAVAIFYAGDSVFAQTNSTATTDTLKKTNLSEAGVSMKVYYYNSFAPEWYMRDFTFNPSPGIFYKREINRSTFRVGYLRLKQAITTVGGKWPEERTSTVKQSGSIVFAGIQKQFFGKGGFQFYGGADIAIAHFSLDGFCESYDGYECFEVHKKMTAIGLNPFAGISITFVQRIRISVESSFDNWRINESKLIMDPVSTVKSKYFISAPSPLSAVTISCLF